MDEQPQYFVQSRDLYRDGRVIKTFYEIVITLGTASSVMKDRTFDSADEAEVYAASLRRRQS